MQIRLIEGLLNSQIRSSSNVLQLAEERICITLVSLKVVSHDLDIDRGRQAKVQNLADHVGGQEREADPWKLFWKGQTTSVNVVVGGMVRGGKCDKNIGVRCADRSRIAVRKIDAAIGQTYVVNDVVGFARRNLLSNRPFNLVAKVGGFFDAHSGGRTKMELERSAVNAGKEVLAQPGDQNRERTQTGREERNQKSSAVVEANFQQTAIAVTKSLTRRLKTLQQAHKRIATGGVPLVLLSPQKVLCHGRNDCPRQEIRGQHGENNCFGERHK